MKLQLIKEALNTLEILPWNSATILELNLDEYDVHTLQNRLVLRIGDSSLHLEEIDES
jgi:hypothetical protein